MNDELCEECQKKVKFDWIFMINLCKCPKELRFVRHSSLSTETTEEDWGNPIVY